MDGSLIAPPSDTSSETLCHDLGLVGSSAVMAEVRRDIERFAPLPATVLVTGATGTGKELVAWALHRASPRARAAFVDVNAGALPPTLIASELFGHVRGAFTGAFAAHRGVFEQADGGTLFIDEVAELPLDLQAWLLRVLESGQVRPLGGERSRKVNVRVIAATAVDLELAVRTGRFRSDLYYRLAVLTIVLPRLATRKEDIAALAPQLLTEIALDRALRLTSEALQVLCLHEWPGNVRELRSVLTRAVAMSASDVLEADVVASAIGRRLSLQPPLDVAALEAALESTGGNMSAAARLVGLPRTTFRERLRESGRTAPTLN